MPTAPWKIYFEGRAEANIKAARGYSRDQRPDCKQVNIGLVCTPEGLPIGYEVFAGNTTDVTTVEDMVELMENKYGQAKRIWVMDRGMISEDNLDFLRKREARYIVGTPKQQLRRFKRPNFLTLPISAPKCSPEWKSNLPPILVCFLTLALWRTLEMWMKGKGLGDCARQLLKEVSTVRSMDVVFKARPDTETEPTELRLRVVARPDKPVAELLQHLGLQLPHAAKIVQKM